MCGSVLEGAKLTHPPWDKPCPHTNIHTHFTHTHTYTGRPPFNGANHIQLLANIERQEPHLADSLPAHLSPACRHLISRLLRRLPEHRMGFDEFFTHAFFQGGLSPDVRGGGEWGGDPWGVDAVGGSAQT